MTRCVTVKAQKQYNVYIGAGLLSEAGERIKALMPDIRAAVITDSNVAPLHLETLQTSLKNAGIDSSVYIFPAGEQSKRLSTVENILEWLAQQGFSRTDCVIALGGGVTGDMAGFAAAVYLRGVRYVQIPTTLLAAVDSSVGGKTGVDLGAGKNLAGAFKQPEIVLCDTDTLKTLPQHVVADGMAETIKYGVLFSPGLFDTLAEGMPDDLTDIITECVTLKAHIVEIDEIEQRERKLLNLGHTLGHAIEKCSNFTVTHGHAVAAGTALIARAGEAMGITQKGTADRVEACLLKHSLPIGCDYAPVDLAQAAMSDKKRSGDSITLVLIDKIGECSLKKVPASTLLEYARYGRK
ncbi:MAG: 3-dehydroquinate synthase [Clostridia bacterium]|nr:3-dehydroquinate synthase [Clostridia bacterium]